MMWPQNYKEPNECKTVATAILSALKMQATKLRWIQTKALPGPALPEARRLSCPVAPRWQAPLNKAMLNPGGNGLPVRLTPAFALVRARCVSTGAVQRCQPVNLRVHRENPIFMVAARAARDQRSGSHPTIER